MDMNFARCIIFNVALLFLRLGFTEVVISDQGREFVNKVNEEFMALAGMS